MLVLMRLLQALLIVASTRAFACAVTVTELPQVLVHRAAIVAQGTATDAAFTFQIEKVWKGTISGIVRLSGIHPTGSTCDTYAPTIAGNRYVLLMETTDVSGAASVVPLANANALTEYLDHPKKVSRSEVIAAMETWQRGRTSDAAFARWLRDTAPVAEAEDLTIVRVLYGLNQFFTRACELAIVRARFVPAVLAVFRAKIVTPELEKAADDAEMAVENACP